MANGQGLKIMIEIEGKIVSADLLRDKFACDLSQCKGACCIEGDAGAPLEIEEVDILEEEYENYKPYMTAEGIKAVEEQGFMVVDVDGDYTTPLIYMPSHPTLSTGIYNLQKLSAYMDGGMTAFFAAIIISMIPILLIFTLTQRKIFSINVEGGIKG